MEMVSLILYPGITVIPQNGKIIFTKCEPFGRLFI